MSNTRNRKLDTYLIPLSFDGAEVLNVDTGSEALGWMAYFSEATATQSASVLLRLAAETRAQHPVEKRERDTALEVRELRVLVAPGTAGFGSSLLREIPILRIEAAINQTAHRHHLKTHAFTTSQGDAEGVPSDAHFRAAPTKAPIVERRSLAIDDPGGYRKPDEFYRHVADLYLHLAAVSGRPAHELAQANNVPVATVHRWIREARARQILLLPTHRGGVDRSGP